LGVAGYDGVRAEFLVLACGKAHAQRVGVLSLPDPVAARIGQFTGRAWVLPSLLRWLDDATDRYLILTGSPGSGKSTLVAWLAGWGPAPDGLEARGQLERVRALAAAAHFCRFDSGNVAPKAFAEAMSRQLTADVEGFSDALVAALGRDLVRIQVDIQASVARHVTGVRIGRLDLRNLGDEISFDRAFRDPLIKLYERGYTEPMLLLVDGLDEAQAYTGTPLPRLLARLGDLPAQVRFLLTTRDDPRVLAFFRRAQPVDLIAGAPAGADDVGRYVTRRLQEAFGPAKPKKTAALAARISAAAKGNFLYAYLVLNGLPDIPETLPLPGDLSGFYRDFLLREVTPDESLWTEVYRPLLGLLAVAEEPGLTRTQLERIIGQEVERALRACQQFLSGNLPDGPFRFFHRSFVDFLLGEDIDYRIDASRIHRQITGYYLGTSGDGTGVDDYGLRHLAAHLELAGQVDALHELLGRGQRNGGQQENAWYAAKAAAGQLDGYQADVERAYRLAANDNVTHLQARYILDLSSVRGTAVRVPPRLLELCLQEDILTWQQVLDSARLHQYPVVRAGRSRASSGPAAFPQKNGAKRPERSMPSRPGSMTTGSVVPPSRNSRMSCRTISLTT
jgi:energy-coupling factor transporter ATP-binding protein EcfA2